MFFVVDTFSIHFKLFCCCCFF